MSLKFFTRFFLMSLLALLSLPGVSLAHPPAQEPVFEVVFNNSAILSQKATLNASYFARSGTLNGLIVDSGSLRLAPGAGSGTFTSNPVRSPLGVTTDLVPAWRAELPEGSSFELEVRFSSNGSNWDNWRKVPALSNLENAGGFISSNTDEEAGGDTHFWGVWHSGMSFDAYLKRYDRFMSEFGYQAFPDIHTINSFAKDNELDSTLIDFFRDNCKGRFKK